jgi:AcrR family transcriptional regulator
MDELTAEAGRPRGALNHNLGDKRGLLAAVVNQIDSEMAARAKQIGASEGTSGRGCLRRVSLYRDVSLYPEVQGIVLLDGLAVLADPSRWPSHDNCLQVTLQGVERLWQAES